MHTYTFTDAHIHTEPHIYRHKVLHLVYYSCNLVISSYQMSYQQYFNILLNYVKQEVYYYK